MPYGFVGIIKSNIFIGKTYYIEPYHSGRNPNMNKPYPDSEKCPFYVNHNPNDQDNFLECTLCRL